MFTRIMCCRGNVTDLSILAEVISYDHNIIGLGETVIISPNKDQISQVTKSKKNYHLIEDKDMIIAYPALKEIRGQLLGWYYQQMLKWCAMDMLQHDRFMIQDSDSYMAVLYDPFRDGKLNFITNLGSKQSPDNKGKGETYVELMHRYPVVYHDVITEFCPYSISAWLSLKNRIESIHCTPWLDSVIKIIRSDWFNIDEFNRGACRNFFEYHIMVNHAVHEKFPHAFLPTTWIALDHPASIDSKKGFQRIAFRTSVRYDDAVV